MKLTELNDLTNPWQIVAVTAPDKSMRFFIRSDTGNWGEIVASLALNDEELEAESVAVLKLSYGWVAYDPSDRPAEKLDSTDPSVYSHEESETPVEEA